MTHPDCTCNAVIEAQKRQIESLQRELKEWKRLTMAWRRKAGAGEQA